MDPFTIGDDEAIRLGHSWVGQEHTLLGILRGDRADVARQALERAGLCADDVETRLRRMDSGGSSDSDSVRSVSPNPRWYGTRGRAEGIARALGAAEPDTVHFLLAMLWVPERSVLTDTPGVSREAIVAALTELGAELPLAPLPELERRIQMTTRVEFPRRATGDVLDILTARFPPGSGPAWGFNYKDDEVAWASAEAGIDLQAIVDEALGGTEHR